MTMPFGSYAAYYDLLYKDKDYAGEAAFVAAQIEHAAPQARTIVDLGCGTGVHDVALARLGYVVTGIDRSAAMIEIARQRQDASPSATADRLSFEEGDLQSLDLGRHYDAAVSLFHVMSYQTTNQDLAAALAATRRHLPAGAPFLFDFWHGPAIVRNGPAAPTKVAENDDFCVVRKAEPTWEKSADIVRVHYKVSVTDKQSGAQSTFEEEHPVRYFFVPALTDRLRMAGFEVRKCAEWTTDQPVTDDTFGAYILAIAV